MGYMELSHNGWMRWIIHWTVMTARAHVVEKFKKLDPVGSTVRYKMMNLCNGSVVVGNL